jgi:hypothetical protein
MLMKQKKENKNESTQMVLEVIVTAFIIVVLSALMIKVIFY